jgi:membrane-associated phospholipid phosphatase
VDQWVIKQVLLFRTPLLTAVMEAVTNLGGITIIGPCSLVLVAYFLFRRHYDRAVGLATAVCGGIMLNNLVKIIIHRPRPLSATTLLTVSGWSFPSGHAMNSMIFYGMTGYLLAREIRSRSVQTVIITFASGIVFIIGLSRIYLQVHYLSDVMAGFAGGLLWLGVCIAGMERTRRSHNAPEEHIAKSTAE